MISIPNILTWLPHIYVPRNKHQKYFKFGCAVDDCLAVIVYLSKVLELFPTWQNYRGLWQFVYKEAELRFFGPHL